MSARQSRLRPMGAFEIAMLAPRDQRWIAMCQKAADGTSIAFTYENKGRRYPYNSKKRGWR